MTESRKQEDTKIEDATPYTPVTKRQRASRHCKRFWWAWLIGFLLFVLVLVLIIIFAAIPAIAQKKINDTELELHSLKILNPTAESFELSINGSITGATGTAAHARLEKMDVKLFLEGDDPIQPFMILPMDEIHGGDNVPVIKEQVPVEITDEAALDEFALRLMDNDLLRVAMRGRTEMWLGKIHTGVDYNEVVELKALNQLKGMVITKYGLVANNVAYNVEGEVMIPNPSVVTIQMGDVGLKIGLKGAALGTGVIPGLILRPGNNTYRFTVLIPDEENIIEMASAAIGGDTLTIGSNGTSIDGVKIPWLSKPLEKLSTEVPINTKYFEEN